MVSSMIASKGYVEIPFKQYFSFSNTHTGSSRFTVATQSLDRLWTAWRTDGYNLLGAPQPVPGYGFGMEEKSVAIATSAVTILTGSFAIAARESQKMCSVSGSQHFIKRALASQKVCCRHS